jgi:hypothetical protein
MQTTLRREFFGLAFPNGNSLLHAGKTGSYTIRMEVRDFVDQCVS